MKYPKTYHLPFSIGTSDDKTLDDASHLLNKEIVITSKLDGSSVALLRDNLFARSHAHIPTHPSFDYLKQLHASIKHDIPENIIIYGENGFAKHTIPYTSLPNYLLVFNILDTSTNSFLSWDSLIELSEFLNMERVPTLFRGHVKTEKELEKLVLTLAAQKEFGVDEREGVVVRLADSFHADDFPISVAKYVKRSFTDAIGDEHWKHKRVVKNGLRQ